jgi:L-alanine-DL-glutamate epimerase-like enolase superfamily enzyme
LRITDIRLAAAKLPLSKPLRTAIHDIRTVCCLLLTLDTDSGLLGEGYGFAFDMERLHSTIRFIESLRSLVLGRDPHDVEAMWTDLFRAFNFHGQAGVAILAANAVDVACWDIVGKAAGRPLYKLFGAHRDRVPVYASGGLWLSSNLQELALEAREFLSQGFRAMKLRLGSARWQEDVARVEAVRDAIGPEVALMVDANQGLDPTRAIRLGRALERFDLVWFEEPLPTWDDAGNAELARALDVPIASGETEYTRYGIRRMAEARAADIFMPDLQRMGGYTEMRKAVHYLAANDLRVAPHIFTEHSLHVVASAANGIYAEHMPWFAPLFREQMHLDAEGMVALPDRPGIGFTFNWDAIERHRVKIG